MRILLDTNILLRLDDKTHRHHADVQSAVELLGKSGHEMVLVPQVIYEYWVVATRPMDVNGLGLDVIRVNEIVTEWLELFTLLRDERSVFRFWHELVVQHVVKGKNAHDARIVAAMQRHAVSEILTHNATDFSRFGAIRVWSPNDILTGQFPV